MEGESDGVVVDGGQCSDSIGRDGVGFLTQRTDWSYIILNGAEEQKRFDSCEIFSIHFSIFQDLQTHPKTVP